MRIKSLVALAVISIAPLAAQLASPNATGDAIGHVHLNVKDIDAQQRFWTQLGGTPINNEKLQMMQFPGIFVILRKQDSTGGTVGLVNPRERLAAFQNSRAGEFLEKVMDDRAPNLAVLLAWGTLNTLFPLVLGILAIAGFILRDPQRLDQLTGVLFAVLPQEAATSLSSILNSTRESAASSGVSGGKSM